MRDLSLACCRRLFFTRLFRVWRKDGVQRIAFLSRPEFYDAVVADIFNQTLQNSASQTGPRHLASAKKNRRLDLVAFVQKTQHVVFLGLVIVIVHVDAELHFFDGNRLLVLLGLALFFFLLVQEFPIIHDAANRGLRGGGNLDQVQILFAGHLKRFKWRHDSDLLAFIADHANLSAYLARLIAMRAFRDAFNLDHIKRGYYSIHALNPTRVVPLGPELAWAPHAMLHNPQLSWREIDATTVEVSAESQAGRARVRLIFENADITRVEADDPRVW